jgi:hypothetical protein
VDGVAQVLSRSDIEEFVDQLFASSDEVKKGSAVIKGILDAGSIRLTDVAQKMDSTPQANYKAIQRYLADAEPQEGLWRLYQDDAPFIIGDPTEIARPQAKKTAYVGRLKDGKTRGFWLLLLGTPYRGRTIPFHFITYSSSTIAQEGTSRNQEHNRAFADLKEMIGDKPLVLDREFSYERLLQDLVEEKINFVIRLNTGNKVALTDEEGKPISLDIAPGQKVCHQGVYYRGRVKVNLVGHWKRGLKEALWVISTLECEKALEIYQARMNIEQTFKDAKSLLGMDRVMNKQRGYMEKMVALLLIGYALGVLVGEEVRDLLYGGKKNLEAVLGPVCATEAEAATEH